MEQTTLTAEELRQKALDCRARREESFQRSDTDGFVSQHCSQLSGSLYDEQADIVEAGGKALFTGLYEGDRRVRAKLVDTRYGTCWLLADDEADRLGRKFIPTGVLHFRASKVQKSLGLMEHREWDTAWAKLDGNGTGISGLANVYVRTFRTGDPWGQDAECAADHDDDF